MTTRDIIRRKEKEEKKADQPQRSAQETLLEELCGEDKELREVLRTMVLLNPEMIVKEGANSYVEKAMEFKKAKDHAKARIAYQVAGEIAIYEANLEQAQMLFKEAAEIDPTYAYRKVFEYFNNAEKAKQVLAKAQQFYGHFLADSVP